MRQGPSRSKARQQPPQAQHSREGTASRELKPVIAGVVFKLAPGGAPGRPARAAHAPGPTAVMRGSPPRHKRASGLREPGTGPSILRRLNTRTRRPTEQWRTRLRFAPVHLYRRSILRALQ